ncbi:MAG TPA: electron transfer flavoprotein subunit alpha/FixB family protein [Clostridia bacterium]|nr:electron transfer flavoprotein subunit alpha/FixB family protein [Clostridia bacterium]
MVKIIINQNKAANPEELVELCPFSAIEYLEGQLQINAACKMCKICVKSGPAGVFELKEETVKAIDKAQWKGIAVYVEHRSGEIHPVTYELIGKAKEMAGKINHPVYCVFLGHDIKGKAYKILEYGVDNVFVYDNKELEHFRIEPYTAVIEDFINKVKPSVVLVGGTTTGRSLAPRAAARFRTGLTADCTVLDIQENTDMDQIRPAFGGNIMAHIFTPNHRPQFATVRYKIFSAPEITGEAKGKVILCAIEKSRLDSRIKVLDIREKEKVEAIEDAEVIVVAGRAFKKQEDLQMVHQLADLLGARVAATRPVIEAGWADARKQIGLSGRTVKPKLIITCGVSGSVQFAAGMNNSECIIAINNDPHAPIFNVAHYGIVGDVYEIIPELIKDIREYKNRG